jgi:uncharacterized protein YjbI with pentapeptide repeats
MTAMSTRYPAAPVVSAPARGREHLSSTDLHLAGLSATDLPGADLRQADLQEARLRDTCLHAADLRDANLRGADLEGADLDARPGSAATELLHPVTLEGWDTTP